MVRINKSSRLMLLASRQREEGLGIEIVQIEFPISPSQA
jgi:hypothetical protein